MKSKILALSAVGILALPIAMFTAQTAAADDRLPPPDPNSGRYLSLPPKDMTPEEMSQRLATPPSGEPSEPYWTTSFTDQVTHEVYKNIKMLGANPELKASNHSVTAKVVVIPVIVTIGKTVFNPTTAIPTACAPGGHTALDLVQKSPLFNDITLKVGNVALGKGQYPDLFQRGNFHKYISTVTPNYNLVLDVSYTKAIGFNASGAGGVVDESCGKGLGLMDIDGSSGWDAFAQRVIQDNKALLPPNVFPFFLFSNVVLFQDTSNNCCILGYHSFLENNNFNEAFQPYGVGDFDSSHDFTGTSDISALSHEVNEWQDDPFTNNPTPSWGNIGQVSGCQANLEVGDPLSGNIYPIALNGFTYHVQDLAFVSWFYETKPSIGSNGWYSLFGTDEKDATDSTFRNFKTTPAVEPCG